MHALSKKTYHFVRTVLKLWISPVSQLRLPTRVSSTHRLVVSHHSPYVPYQEQWRVDKGRASSSNVQKARASSTGRSDWLRHTSGRPAREANGAKELAGTGVPSPVCSTSSQVEARTDRPFAHSRHRCVCVCVYVCPDTMLHHTIKGITARRSFGYVRNRRLYHAWPRMARGIIAPNSSATKRAGGCDKIGARSCGTANIHIDAKPIHSTPSASVSCTHIRTFTGIIRVADPMKQASMWYSIRTRRRAKQLFFGPWGRRTKPA